MFVISLVRRWDVYVNAIRLLISVRGRWPKLIARLSEHSSLILNRAFFRPALLAFGLTLVQLVASRVIFPQATLTGEQLQTEWWWVLLIVVPLVPMVLDDIYFVICVGKIDHDETVKYFDQAETWLGWKGPLVRVLTLGVVNPQQMVDEEVKKNLTEYQSTLQASLWWVSLQIGLRLLFGLTLWAVWAVHRYII
jgi:hypothetical protein